MHVLPLPLWLEIPPSLRSLLEWTLPLGLLSDSAIMVAPQPSELLLRLYVERLFLPLNHQVINHCFGPQSLECILNLKSIHVLDS